MNSTRWETLGQFTQWLGREGYCKVCIKFSIGDIYIYSNIYILKIKNKRQNKPLLVHRLFLKSANKITS